MIPEDTFILLDAIEQDEVELCGGGGGGCAAGQRASAWKKPLIVLEIG